MLSRISGLHTNVDAFERGLKEGPSTSGPSNIGCFNYSVIWGASSQVYSKCLLYAYISNV